MPTKPIENQQLSIVLGTSDNDLTYLTTSYKGFNKRCLVFVGITNTRNIVTESTKIQQVS